jgi:hypothetical protein
MAVIEPVTEPDDIRRHLEQRGLSLSDPLKRFPVL